MNHRQRITQRSPQGGGEKREQAATAEPNLTARARDLYENSAVPVREIARLCGVTERTIYKYAGRQDWQPRYRWNADGTRPVAFAPAKGAGGRFIRREDKGKAFAKGLKATDPVARARAEALCAAARAADEAAVSCELRVKAVLEAARMLEKQVNFEVERKQRQQRYLSPAQKAADETLSLFYANQVGAAAEWVASLARPAPRTDFAPGQLVFRRPMREG